MPSDRIGRPKGVALAGYGLSMVARIGLLFAGGFWALTAVVTADRIGKGIRTAPRDALITVSAQPEYLARHFGVHRMLDNIGAASGPLLAFLILMLIPNGYGTVFVVSLAFAVIGVAVLALLVPNLKTGTPAGTAQRNRAAARPLYSAGACCGSPDSAGCSVAAGLLGLLTVGDGFIYLVLQDRDSFAVQWFPLLYVGTNVVFLLLAIPLGRLADRWGKARVFILGHVALLACYLLAAAPVGGFGPTVACLVLLGCLLRRDGRGPGGAGEPADSAGQTCHGDSAPRRRWWRSAGWPPPPASVSCGLRWVPPSRWWWWAAALPPAVVASWFILRRVFGRGRRLEPRRPEPRRRQETLGDSAGDYGTGHRRRRSLRRDCLPALSGEPRRHRRRGLLPAPPCLTRPRPVPQYRPRARDTA